MTMSIWLKATLQANNHGRQEHAWGRTQGAKGRGERTWFAAGGREKGLGGGCEKTRCRLEATPLAAPWRPDKGLAAVAFSESACCCR